MLTSTTLKGAQDTLKETTNKDEYGITSKQGLYQDSLKNINKERKNGK